MHAYISPDMLRRTRHVIKNSLPGIPAAHVSEAVAASLGHASGVALSAWLREWDGVPPDGAEIRMDLLAERLRAFGHPVEHIPDYDSSQAPPVPRSIFSNTDPAMLAALLTAHAQCQAGEDMRRYPDGDTSMELALMQTTAMRGHASLLATQANPWPYLAREREGISGHAARMTRLACLACALLDQARRVGTHAFDAEGLEAMLELRYLDAVATGVVMQDLPDVLRAVVSAYTSSLPHHPEHPMVRLDQHGYAAMRLWGLFMPKDGFSVLRCRGWTAMVGMLAPGGRAHCAESLRLRLEGVLKDKLYPLNRFDTPEVVGITVLSSRPGECSPRDSIPMSHVLKPLTECMR